MKDILFFDLEVGSGPTINDIGAWYNGTHFHEPGIKKFTQFSAKAAYICGHNIINHDIPLLREKNSDKRFFKKHFIDTVYLSTLLFPTNPYHKLVKDYKLVSEEPNNPVSDAKLAAELFSDCLRKFQQLESRFKSLYFRLLNYTDQFRGFFSYLAENRLLGLDDINITAGSIIKEHFKDKLCINNDLNSLMKDFPLELTYALTLINTPDSDSVPPAWLVHHHPEILPVFHRLRYNRCGKDNCLYCHTKLDPKIALKNIFGFEKFMSFETDKDIPLQEQVVNAALNNKSFLAIFPTGGGKSLTFQLPALMRGEACRSLTVVISPLQSLMKDQVDILKDRHERTDAVAINSLLSPLERAEAIKKVDMGGASILYISPESLRSNSIARIIKGRIIDRFVIDEAHCFSSWGQDFRTDYLYIGKFLSQLKKEKNLAAPIPVSCFTATAKPAVIEDIKDYFQKKLGIELEVFKTAPKRKNLAYGVFHAADDIKRFTLLIDLLSQDEGPKIVYTTRVKRSEDLAEKLKDYGFNAAAYNGRMTGDRKIKTQNDFMNGSIDIIVATSAFGMGIDKGDVSMVIHYNIADSLENYMQEAGRAGRNREMKANCYVLYDDSDLMGHFSLLNSTRINKKEIFQVWQGIKKIKQEKFSRSALELARAAGWDSELQGWETRIKTGLTALEESGLIQRGQNLTRIFATGLQVKNMEQAANIIRAYDKFDEADRLSALRIIKFIISYKSCGVDFIADTLGLGKYDTRRLINELKGVGILGSDRDLTAYVNTTPGSKGNSSKIFQKFLQLEFKFFETVRGNAGNSNSIKRISLKEINSHLRTQNINSDIESLRTILFHWQSRHLINKKRIDRHNHIYQIEFKKKAAEIKKEIMRRLELARRILNKLMMNADPKGPSGHLKEIPVGDSQDGVKHLHGHPTHVGLVEFSINELRTFAETDQLFKSDYAVTDYDKTLLYLNEISAIRLDQGLFVYYNPFSITRCDSESKREYSSEDYKKFAAFYQQKIEQIHIVGEYARKLLKNYKEAMTFVDDYFTLDYQVFIKKYFPGRITRIRRPITEQQFEKIYKDLSPDQLNIINDNKSRFILVAAGPGSGKTRVLVHKVASLLTLEDVRTEQFLMLTYSRSAAIEMKERLRSLIGKKARYIDIFTFHSFAFHIAEIKGDLEQLEEIIPRALELIKFGQAVNKVENKSVLVIDEFQDISSEEFELIETIINTAGEIRVLAVGDDDQNIFEFRGSSARYMKDFKEKFAAKIYHLNTNYRSKNNLVQFSNLFIKRLPERVKADQALISAAPGENGKITITKYKSGHLVTPLVRDITGRQDKNLKGTTAVLTATNDEALQVYTLLRQQGIKAKLLVSYADFSLKSLLELKMFSFYIKEWADSSAEKIIPAEQWQEAREQIKKKFSRSKQLKLALTVIDSFEKEYENLLEINWREYLEEVKLEDFIFPDKETVFISTMHKAKGKEFDNVFLLLDNFKTFAEEKLRVLYVALTRAKENLFIHTNIDIFDNIFVSLCNRLFDDGAYSEPERLSLQFNPRDVYLDYSTHENIIKNIKSLQAGDILAVSEHDPTMLTYNKSSVLKFSNSGAERIEKFLNRGYDIESIHAEYIVIWKKKEDEEQYRIVLPRIELHKTGRA